MPKQIEFFNDLKATHKNSNHSLSSNSVIRSELKKNATPPENDLSQSQRSTEQSNMQLESAEERRDRPQILIGMSLGQGRRSVQPS